MIKAVLRTAITLAILAWLVPTITIASIGTLIIASIVLALLFGVIQPLLKILFLPINFVTLGLFSALLNVFLLWVGVYLVPGFTIEPTIVFGVLLSEFWTLVFVAVLLGFTNSLVRAVL